MGTSRRVRGPAAHRAAGGEPPLASRGMQNSQRVLLAQPRTAKPHDAKPRTAPMARRRDGDIAPYRNGTARWERMAREHATGHEGGRKARWRGGASVGRTATGRNGARARDAKPRTAAVSHRRRCGAAARSSATGPHHGARQAAHRADGAAAR